MNREEAEKDMHRLLNEAARKATDRNVEMLKTANRALQRPDDEIWTQRQVPGTRPDGGMASADRSPVDVVRNAMEDARRIVDNFEKEVINLESQIAQLKAQLDAERDVRQHLEKQIAQICELVSPPDWARQ